MGEAEESLPKLLQGLENGSGIKEIDGSPFAQKTIR